jgi:two-component system sensor histidine kinase UhpB
LQGGRLDVKLPRLAGTEATAIGAAFNRMVDELQIHIETERRAVRAELKLSDSRELTRWIDQHIERERLLIARELHDELGQSVTAIRSMALSIAQRIQGLDPQAETAARLIADESSRLYDAMHGMIPRLTPLVLDNFGLAEALDELLVRTRLSQPQVLIESTIEIGSTALASDTALTLYRAAQEGISNALRHGQARHLQLSIANADDMLTLTLQDDGLGLAADWSLRKGHYGLRWLTERAEGVGGELRVEAGVSGGVLLLLRLPLLARPEAAAE